jgi:kynurenine formamidase
MIIDLSHEISAGLVTYPGLAAPRLQTVVTSARRMASFLVRAVAVCP